MELANRTDGALAVSEPEHQEDVAASTPHLFLVQDRLANQPETSLEKPPEKFYLVGIDRVGGLTILKGIVNGQPRAIVTHIPPELLLPPEEGRPDTAFERIRAGAFGKVAAVLALVGASVAAMAGCTPDNKPKIGSNAAALTADDVDNLGEPVAAAWTEAGDNRPQISEMDGNTVVTFIRGGDVYYVDCAELEDCLTEGVPEAMADLPDFSYYGAAIYQTPEGNNKVIFGIDSIYEMDVSNVGGILTASGDPIEITSGEFSNMQIDGIPHILRAPSSSVVLRNMFTGGESLLGLDGDPMAICGTPHQDDGGVAIGSFLYNPGAGPSYCRLHSAPTLEGLAEVLGSDFIASQNIDGTNLTNPRSLGNILIYVRNDADGNRIYYAIAPIVPPADGGGDADEGPGPDPDADAGGEDGPGTDADASPGGGPEAGTGDDADASEGEGEDGTDGPETSDGPTTPREDGGTREDGDTPKPDANEGENPLTCDLGVGGASVTVIEQNCTFSDCDNGNNDGDVTINGDCTVEVNLGEYGNGTPVRLTVDGQYSVNVLEQVAGQLISGLFEAETGGNDFRSAYGAYVTGPEGTTYGGEGSARMSSTNPSDIDMSHHPEYRVFVEAGRVTVFFNGEEVMTLNAGQEFTFPQGGPNATDPNQPGCGACDLSATPGNSGPSGNSLGFALFALAAALRSMKKKRK